MNYYENTWYKDEETQYLSNERIKEIKLKRKEEAKKKGFKEDFQILPKYHEKTDLYIPPISLSTLRLSYKSSANHGVIHKCLNSGINLYESSTIYPDSQYILADLKNEENYNRSEQIYLSKAGFETEETPVVCKILG